MTCPPIKQKRWSEGDENSPGFFPKDKYGFSTYLTDVGDFVRTYPLSKDDRFRFKRAAYDWAWHHKCRVEIRYFQKSEDTWEVECTLVAKIYIRDFL